MRRWHRNAERSNQPQQLLRIGWQFGGSRQPSMIAPHARAQKSHRSMRFRNFRAATCGAGTRTSRYSVRAPAGRSATIGVACPARLSTLKTDFCVSPVAKRFALAAAAAAEPRGLNASHHTTRAARDLEISLNLQRTVDFGFDRQQSVANRQHVRCAGRRLTTCTESHIMMRAVAIRLIARGAAAAQGHAKACRNPGELQLPAKGVRACFAYGGQIDRRRRFVGRTVPPCIPNGARRTRVGNLDEPLDGHRVGMNPRSLNVGEEDLRRTGNAEPRMYAATGLKLYFNGATGHHLDGIRRGRRLAWRRGLISAAATCAGSCRGGSFHGRKAGEAAPRERRQLLRGARESGGSVCCKRSPRRRTILAGAPQRTPRRRVREAATQNPAMS